MGRGARRRFSPFVLLDRWTWTVQTTYRNLYGVASGRCLVDDGPSSVSPRQGEAFTDALGQFQKDCYSIRYIVIVRFPDWRASNCEGGGFMKRWRLGIGLLLISGLVAGASVTFLGCRPAAPTHAEENPPDADAHGPPFFREIKDSGIDFSYTNGEKEGEYVILQIVGGGVGLIDYDGDGLLDVFVPGGGGFAGPDGKAIVGRPCKLYKNLGGFHFRDVTREVGLDDFPWFYTHGVAVADYDRDGWPDLLVTGWGRVALFHNEPVDPKNPVTGGRKFVEVKNSGLDGITWATSAAWADFDGDGYPDLYVTQYVNWSWDNNPPCRFERHVGCKPFMFDGLPDKLFANRRNGKFRDVSSEAGLRGGSANSSKGLAVVAVDVNDDGKPDIYVCNDTTENFLYINHCTPGHFRFDEVGVRSGTARDDRGNPNGSMGCDAADYDGCGRPSLWVTNFEGEQHALYHNNCTPENISFLHRTAASGIASSSQPNVGWGTGFLDVDHHGWEDILYVNGDVYRDPTKFGRSRRQRPVLLRNLGGGKFKDLSVRGGSFFQTEHLSRGLALGDLDNDGRIDAIVSNLNEPVAVLRNESPTDGAHWLGVELVNTDHADVVGTKVRLEAGGRTQWRFAKGGGSFASSGDRRLLFGLAKADSVGRVVVTWPDGQEQTWTAPPCRRTIITASSGEKRPEKPQGE